MNNKWVDILSSIEPEYHKLAKILDDGPSIRPILVNANRKNVKVVIREVWPNDYIGYTTHLKLDERINWVEKELIKWKKVRRTSWDTWQFSSILLAEKFITLYYLKWAE